MLSKPVVGITSSTSLNTEMVTGSAAVFFSLVILATRASCVGGGNTPTPVVKKSNNLSV